jgi:hypothetical protein
VPYLMGAQTEVGTLINAEFSLVTHAQGYQSCEATP